MACNDRDAPIPFAMSAIKRMEYFEVYDTLPEEYRKLLQEAPYNLCFRSLLPVASIKGVFARSIKREALAAYGPEHPQVQA